MDASLTADGHPNLSQEAVKLVAAAESKGLYLRLIGGLGIYQTCPSAHRSPLAREYKDIDFVTAKDSGSQTRDVLADGGYEGDRRFNALHGATRMLFHHATGGWQVDIFLGTFSMCHSIDLNASILPGQIALPLADLLLTKLQIVEMNIKDVKDAIAILLDHSVGRGQQPDDIDLDRLIATTSKDWGLYTTVTDCLHRVRNESDELLDGGGRTTVQSRIDAILVSLASAPKSAKWKLRSQIGRRILWYDLPDEVAQ